MASMDTYAVAKGLSEAHRENIAERDQAIDRWMAKVKKLEHEIALHRANAAGFMAFINEVKRLDPQNPAFGDSGRRYKTGARKGRAKSIGRIAFEAAHDAEAKALGIRNPAEFRDD